MALSVSEDILRECLRNGAVAAGIAPIVQLDEESERYFSHWIAEGYNADMKWLENYSDIRSNPEKLLDGSKTIISIAFPYGTDFSDNSHPLISEYALGDDYHTVVRHRLTRVCDRIKSLMPDAESRICVDSAPIHERFWALKTGLGFIGRNGMLIIPEIGSKIFLGEIITTAELNKMTTVKNPDGKCGECKRCIKGCPGGALIGDGRMDARKCYSYQTIENRDESLPVEVNLHGRKIYGCDVCQNVCPFNNSLKTRVGLKEFDPRSDVLLLKNPQDIFNLTDEEYRRIFKNSAVRRCKLSQLKRNARKAMD